MLLSMLIEPTHEEKNPSSLCYFQYWLNLHTKKRTQVVYVTFNTDWTYTRRKEPSSLCYFQYWLNLHTKKEPK